MTQRARAVSRFLTAKTNKVGGDGRSVPCEEARRSILRGENRASPLAFPFLLFISRRCFRLCSPLPHFLWQSMTRRARKATRRARKLCKCRAERRTRVNSTGAPREKTSLRRCSLEKKAAEMLKSKLKKKKIRDRIVGGRSPLKNVFCGA